MNRSSGKATRSCDHAPCMSKGGHLKLHILLKLNLCPTQRWQWILRKENVAMPYWIYSNQLPGSLATHACANEKQEKMEQQWSSFPAYSLISKGNVESAEKCLSCWVLMASWGQGMRRHPVNDIDVRGQVKWKEKTLLFSNGENLLYPSSTQMFQSVCIAGLPLIG